MTYKSMKFIGTEKNYLEISCTFSSRKIADAMWQLWQESYFTENTEHHGAASWPHNCTQSVTQGAEEGGVSTFKIQATNFLSDPGVSHLSSLHLVSIKRW